MRIGRVQHLCGGQGGKSLRRLDDECQIGVELRSTSSALTVALQSRLAQHSLDGVVVDTEMAGLLASARRNGSAGFARFLSLMALDSFPFETV